jgi:hypothetical protein
MATNFFTLTTGFDNFNGISGDTNLYDFTPATLQSTDILTGASGIGGSGDVMRLQVAGTITASQFTGVTNMDELDLPNGTNNITPTTGSGLGRIVGGTGDDTVDGSGVAGGFTFISNGGADTFKGGSAGNDFRFTAASLTSADTVTGGAGGDTLTILSPGTLNASSFTNVTGIELLLLPSGGNTVTLTNSLVAGTNLGYFAVGNGSGDDTIDGSGITNGIGITIYGGTGVDTEKGGNGNDVFWFDVTQLTSADTVVGGAGFDQLTLNSAGTVAADGFANVSGIEVINLTAAENITLTNGVVAGSSSGYLTIYDSAGGDTIDASGVTNGVGITVFSKGGSDNFKGGNGNDVFWFNAADLTSADTIDGGAGVDRLVFTSSGTVAATAFASVTGFEELTLNGGGNNVTLRDSLIAASSVGYFTIHDSANNDTVDGSGITNNVGITIFSEGGTDTFKGGNGNDAFWFGAADLTSADTVDGGAGFDTLNFASTGTLAAAAFTSVSNLEAMTLNGGGNNVTLTNGLVAGTSVGYFTVYDSATNDTVDASGVTNGVGITIFSQGGTDTFKGGNGNESFWVNAADLTSADTIDGGAGFDTLNFATTGTVAAAAFTNVSNLEAMRLRVGNDVTLTNGLVAGTSVGYFTVYDSANADTVDASGVTNNIGITVFSQGGTDTFTGGNGNDSFWFNAADLTSADTVAGGAGIDRLIFNNAGTVAAGALTNVTGLEDITLNGGGNNITLTNGAIAGTSIGYFTVHGSASADTVDASAVTTTPFGFFLGGGADTFSGGGGSDSFNILDSAFAGINGNGGIDRIVLNTPGQSFNLTANAAKITNIEVISLSSSAAASLTLAGGDIPLVNAAGNSLYVVGEANDSVSIGTGWTLLATGVVNNAVATGHTFAEYQHTNGSLLFLDSPIPQAPIITSDGGGDSATLSVDENTTAVTTVVATDGNATTPTYAIVGGDDQLKFTIDSGTGALSFLAAPDFEAPTDFDGNNSYIVQVQATDGTLVDTQTITVNVANVNETPVNTVPGSQTTAEDTPKAIAGVSVADDGSSLTTTLSVLHGSVNVTTGGGATISNNGTGTVTVAGTSAQINNALAGLTYTNTADYNGPDTLTVSTTDGSLTDNDPVSITVTAITDIANDTTTTNEDTLVNIDVNANDSFENLGHTITSINASAITAGGAGVSVTHGSVKLKLDGTLDYTPTADYNGSDSFTYTVTSGGVTETATVDVTVNSVNDAPTFTTPASTTSGEDAGAQSVSNFATAILAGPADESGQTVTFSVTGNTNAGLFSVAPSIAANGTLTYTAAPNANGTATITVVGQDNGGTANSGVDTSVSHNFNINVTAVNDAPVNTSPLTANLDAAFSHTPFTITGLDVSDVDSGAGPIRTTLTTDNGTLTFTLASGTTVVAGTTNGTGTVTLEGTVASIHNTLANNVVFQSADAFSGTAHLTMTTTDQGNTGTGGSLTDVDSFNIGVVPQVWYIDNTNFAANGAGGSGTAADPFRSITDFNNSAGPGNNDYVVIETGTGTYTGDGINLKDGQQLYGAGETLSFTNPAGGHNVTVLDGTGTRPTIHVTTAGDQGIDVASGNTIHGVNIQTDAGNSGLDDGTGANNVGTLTVSHMAISGVGKAVDLDGSGTLAVTLDSISSTGATADGLDLTGMGGSLAVTGGTTISNAGTTGIHVQNSVAGSTFNFGNTNVAGAAGTGVDLTSNVGNVTFADLDINGDVGARSFLASGNTGTITSTTGDIVQNGGSGGFGISGVGTTLNMVLNSLDVSNTTSTGVDIAQVGGSLTVGTTTIANNSLVGVQVRSTVAGSTMDFGNTTISGTHTLAAVRDGIAGQGNAGNVTFDDLDITSTTGPGLVAVANTGTTTVSAGTINTATANAIDLSSNTGGTFNFGGGTGGVDITTTTGTGFSATGGGTVSVSGAGNTINTTTGTALNLNGVTVGGSNVTFDTVNTNGAANGIVVNNVTGGSINVNGGAIAGATANGVSITAAHNNISIASSIASTAAGHSVQVINSGVAGGNTISFTGAVSDQGLGINLDNNDQGGIATINFSGGLNIDSTTHTGFNATNGGIVNVTQNNTSIVNTIDTTTGVGLNVANTTIGASDLNFRSIASNGAADGIVLTTTGNTGGLTVTGNGGTVTSAGTATGGAIQNSTGAGISLTNVGGGVSLTRMYVGDGDSTGILGNNVTGLNLANSFINNNGDAAGEHGVFITGLFGNNSVTNTTFTHNAETQFKVSNTTATVAQGSVAGDILTMSGITMNGQAGSFVGDSLQINADDAANFHLIVNNSAGANSITGGIDGILVNASTGGDADVDISNVTITNTTGPGINFNPVSTGSRVWFDVHDNVISNPGSTAINATAIGNDAAIQGFINNNTITQGATGNGITIITEGDGDNVTRPTATISASNNTITGVQNGSGINAQARVGGILNLTLDNNHVNINNALNLEGIRVTAGSSSPADNIPALNNIVRLNMLNNDVSTGGGQEDYAIQVRGVSTFELQNFTGNGDATNDTDEINWIITTKNNGEFSAADNPAELQIQHTTGGVFTASAGNIPTPSLPTPMLAAAGGVQASSPTPGETHLEQAQLNAIVAAAIGQWAAAGASSAQLAALAALTFTVTDLAGKTIGDHTPGHIVIDSDAAGHGWFVDPTPSDSSEFTHAQNAKGTDLLTDSSSAAAGHLDLLTTVMHEMGHELGLDDSTAAGDANDLMYINLVDGERRLPDAADIVQASEVDIPQISQAPAGTPILAGNAANNTIDAGHGGNVLFGGAGADNFVFGPSIQLNAPTPARITHVADYSAAQGDTFDFSALTSAFHNSSANDAMVVRAVEDASGKFAMLQVDHIDPMGLPSAPNWVNVAQLDGAHAGDSVNVLIDNNHSVHLAQIHVDLLV